MIRPYNRKDLDKYLENDYILTDLSKHEEDRKFSSHEWLLQIPAKRMIYDDLYGSLLKNKGYKILDIGGGFCGLSRQLVKNHDYTLVDIMTRDQGKDMEQISSELNFKWLNIDWNEFTPIQNYDYIIANDIFPNVDERLNIFLKKYKSVGKKIILSLTCYDSQSIIADYFEKITRRAFNIFRRVDADKIIFKRAPTTEETNLMLRNALGEESIILKSENESLFNNGRIVYKVEI